jgi:hypothetical protein
MPMNPRLLRPASAPPPFVPLDSDAAAYITAVEAADTQPLEQAVKIAINDFIIGCKSDGIWDAIKASCILAGARTLSGALVPLKGSAPTNNNFVSGDYNRETGLVGNGTNKYLDTNRLNNADPQSNAHLSLFLGEATAGANARMGAGGNSTGSMTVSFGTWKCRNRTPRDLTSRFGTASGFVGMARNSSASFVGRDVGVSVTHAIAAESASFVVDYLTHATMASTNSPTSYSVQRISFYSIGEYLELATLDARVTALIAAIGAAI